MNLISPRHIFRRLIGFAFLVVAIFSGVAGFAHSQDLVISEFLSANVSGLKDEDGDFSDWIEIHNKSAQDANLLGYSLTDDSTRLDKWVFPSTAISAGGRLIVFASGKNRSQAGRELHTSFQLNSGGEFLALVSPSGDIMTQFAPFPEQFDGVSFGLGVLTVEEFKLGLGAPCKWFIPDMLTEGWETKEFDDSTWAEASSGVGYDIAFGEDSYHELIGEGGNVLTQMRGINATCYIRFPFQVEDVSEVQRMMLGMKYDDGFVAYLNGVEVARDLAPNVPSFATESINARAESEVFEWNEFDVGAFIDQLVVGENVLAIQGLNFGDQSSDFVILPRITFEKANPATDEIAGYFTAVTPGQPNAEPWEGIVGDTNFSRDRGFYRQPFDLAISSSTAEAQIWMTRDGSNPSPENGELYTGPFKISDTTVLRAAAFRDRFAPSNIETQTFLFPATVAMQAEMQQAIVSQRQDEIADAISSLPVVSLAVRPADFFGAEGIYSIPELSGRDAEVPVSMEYFSDDNSARFQVDAGIRIHGGNARDHPKKPFRLYFRSEYGPKRLEFPLFPDSSVESFDQLILRGFGHDGWALADSFGTRDEDIPPHAAFLRDQYLRKTENEIGLLSPVGKYVNVFLNGTYWGFYDLHERPNAAFMEAHLGGEENDFDVLHHPTFVDEDYTLIDGESTAWDELLRLASAGLKTTSAYEEIQQYVDIDDLCDHMIVRMWAGDYDWCGPIFLPDEEEQVSVFSNKNWYAGRWSRNLSPGQVEPFRFWVWDAEMSMGLHLLRNLGFSWVFAEQRELNFDLTQAGDYGSPTGIYAALRQNAEFRQRFGDRLHKHFGFGGALSVPIAQERLLSMSAEIREAVLAESARWGKEGIVRQLTREDWESEIQWLEEQFIPLRSGIVTDQFTNIGLLPEVDPPTLNLRGEIDSGEFLTLSSNVGGTIYYTVDGSDPLLPAIVDVHEFIGEGAQVRTLVPSAENGGALDDFEWRLIVAPDNIDSWRQGLAGVGYDEGTGYQAFIETDVESEMADIHPSAFLRFEFDVEEDFDAASVTEFVLEMRYDDGFVAYLNGTKIAGANEPVPLAWNSFATETHDDNQAILFEPFDVTEFLDLLEPGKNVLAVHFLNASALSSDALLEPKLSAVTTSRESTLSAQARIYRQSIPVTEDLNIAARLLSDDGVWSALETEHLIIGRAPSSENLVISQLHYRPLPAQAGTELGGGWSRSDFEFIEIMNVADGPVKMIDVEFTEGIGFTFPELMLGAGERVVIVANLAAFRARYGAVLESEIMVAGEYSGNLNNGGEFIRLIAPDKTNIAAFRFQDGNSWPASADGVGYSLALKDPFARQNPGEGSNWVRSIDIHGSPGAAFTLTYSQWQRFYFAGAEPPLNSMDQAGDDPDQDGVPNGTEFAFGTDPLVANGETGRLSVTFSRLTDEDSGTEIASIEFRARPELSQVVYYADVSENLESWLSSGSELGPVLESSREVGDGSRLLRFTGKSDIRSVGSGYFRARADISGAQP